VRPPRASGEDDDASAGLDTLPLVPSEWRARMGRYTKEKTAPQLKDFVEKGGTLITIGSSWRVARDLELPIEDALVTKDFTGGTRRLRREEFYVPGSVLSVNVDTTHPIAAGLNAVTDVMFAESPAFRITDAARARAIATFGKLPLRSGWAWGQSLLDGTVAAAEARLGSGRVYTFGPEITFRAQPHGTFKLLFNAIYYGAASSAR
jgi:hypothetical protein